MGRRLQGESQDEGQARQGICMTGSIKMRQKYMIRPFVKKQCCLLLCVSPTAISSGYFVFCGVIGARCYCSVVSAPLRVAPAFTWCSFFGLGYRCAHSPTLCWFTDENRQDSLYFLLCCGPSKGGALGVFVCSGRSVAVIGRDPLVVLAPISGVVFERLKRDKLFLR